MPTLLAVPNVSEGRRPKLIESLRESFGAGVELLAEHSDRDHDRSVFTLAGEVPALADALLAGARTCVDAIDMRSWEGVHPAIGALDVCPIVWPSPDVIDEARSLALEVAERLATELELPAFLYGDLATAPERRERAFFRQGGTTKLAERLGCGEVAPDRGPAALHPSAGGVLVTARPPLAAFNVELDTADPEVARQIAARLRESGGGLTGVRAIGLALSSGRAQVSINVHDPATVPLARVVEEVRALAANLGAAPIEAELVGLVPEAAVAGYPADVPIRGFDPARDLIERRVGV